ncbi:hypothetical protein [Erwinia sp. B116]|uniref:hypothetical protein n=1 Tax=Erwinia sp. B116 TaxID=1561024 RepID=UPI0013044DDB|nr:hypothetical protein [Erwinia sp. B116]
MMESHQCRNVQSASANEAAAVAAGESITARPVRIKEIALIEPLIIFDHIMR